MSLAIRRASLIDDRQEMLDLLNRNVVCPSQEKYFDWRHNKNPVGEAWVWFLCDQNKTAVATVSVFPRRMLVDGQLLHCGQVGGFAVDPPYRSLGPAVLLQRTTFELVNSGALAFCYDCPPHDQRMATFVRLGMPPNCEILRYALVFRSDEYLQARLGKGIWTKPLVSMANLFIGARAAANKLPGLQIDELNGLFGDEFSHLDSQVSSAGVIRASRSAELLNWRHRRCPEWDSPDCTVLVARRAGEPLAFLAFWMERGRAIISDFFGLQLDTVGPALLDAAIEVCKRKKMFSLHGYCSTDSELKPLFPRMGFRRRERIARVVAYEKTNAPARILNRRLHWTFTHIDQD